MDNEKHVQNRNCGKFPPFTQNIINVKPTKNGDAVISSRYGVADGAEHLPVFRMTWRVLEGPKKRRCGHLGQWQVRGAPLLWQVRSWCHR